MKIIIDGKTYSISNDCLYQLKDVITQFIRKNPFNLIELECFNLNEDNSFIPLLYRIHLLLHNKYYSLSLPKRIMIMSFVRGKLASLEQSFGLSARPDKRSDPIEHVLNLIFSEVENQIDHLENEVFPHATIEIGTFSDSISSFTYREDKNKTGGEMVTDGNVRQWEDDSGKADRQATVPLLP